MPEYFIIDEYDLTVKALHKLKCSNCKSSGTGYVNMAFVIDDKVQGEMCPVCHEEDRLYIATYGEDNAS